MGRCLPWATWSGSWPGRPGHDRPAGRQDGAGAPGQPVPARRDPGRRRDELRGGIRHGRCGDAVPVRRRGRGNPDTAAGLRRRRLARLRARGGARAGLRVPGGGPLRSRPRPALQPGEAAARPLRPGGQRRGHVRAGGARVRGGQPGRAEHARLRRAHAAQPGRGRHVRLDRRRPAQAPVLRHDHLRGARQGVHDAPPGGAGRIARHLRRAGARGRRRLPGRPRRDRRRAAARAPERAGELPAAARADELLGLQHHRLLRAAPPRNTRCAAVRAGRPGGQVAEFKAMVDALHAAGIEVILDVVFNHSAEAGAEGPTLCFRGLDNPAYYRLDPADPSRYIDTTGCGNSLNAGDTLTLQLIMDSLRYWVTEMHVDGFRFDLAPSLARQEGGFDQMSAFFDLVAQDPVVSQAKLVAEPWDVGQMDSYDVGRFPPLWREWNGKYRDSMRDFWRSHPIGIGEFATRFCGSADLYAGAGRRRPTASVNLFTVHDGFTLADLVSYNDKHNEANGEDNRDGTDDNRSWNCGTEGPTADPAIVALRARQSRAMLTTLLLSFGVPMLLGGDERGRTQQGNNNAYCQDNEITWFDWSSADEELLAFTRRLIAFRKEHPVFRRRRFLAGKEAAELGWFTFAGTPMTSADWADPGALSLAMYLDGSDAPDRAEDGTPMVDDDFLVLFNAWWEPLDFVIPETRAGLEWRAEIDTYDPAAPAATPPRHAGDRVSVGSRSVAVLRGPRP